MADTSTYAPSNSNSNSNLGSGLGSGSGFGLESIGLNSETMKKPAVIVGIVFLGILIIGVIVYLIIKFSAGLKYYASLTAPKSLTGRVQTELSKADSFPALSNGIEYTYAFWVYVNGVQSTDRPKIMFQRGTVKANPIVDMDTSSNVLTIRLRTGAADAVGITVSSNDPYSLVSTATSTNQKSVSNVKSPLSMLEKDAECYYAAATIEYVPLNQWMHIAVAVQGQYAVIYKDGEIYKVINVETQIRSKCSAQTPKVVTFATTEGSLLFGAPAGFPGINGSMSKLLFFNYAVTLADAKNLYEERPLDTGILSALRLPFGVRSPVYSLDSATVDPTQK
jgi:hypothetical protein